MSTEGPWASCDLPDSICALPWVNLSVDVDGSSRPCCRFAHASADSPYQLANLRDTPLDEVWNSPALQRLRADFRAGVRPAECSTCWDEESAGVRSFRQKWLGDRNISHRPDYDDTVPERPVALDLKLSNACNLKCRICGPVASSTWLVEELQRGDPAPALREHLTANRSYYLSNKITGHEQNLATLRRWAPYVENVELTGGEPMFSRENRELLDVLVEHGRPERLTLVITTNATVVDERIFSLLPRFGAVQVVLSVDDVGPRLEYERSPSSWPEVAANIDRYASIASDRIQVFTNTSISVLNVWYVPEYLDWITTTYPDGAVYPNLNLVHGPRHFCVQVLPPELKQVVADRLTAAAASLAGRPNLAVQVESLRSFLLDVDEPLDCWLEAVDAISERDVIRDQDYRKVFGEFVAEVDRLGLWRGRDGATAVDRPRRTRRLLARLRG